MYEVAQRITLPELQIIFHLSRLIFQLRSNDENVLPCLAQQIFRGLWSTISSFPKTSDYRKAITVDIKGCGNMDPEF